MTMICCNNFAKVIFPLLCFLIAQPFLSNSTYAVENPYKDHYPFNTAIIHFNVSGHETGNETLYVKPDFQALYINTRYNELGRVNPKNVLILTTPEYIYNIDLIKKIGAKIRNFKTDLIKKFDVLSKNEKITVSNNVKELGTAVLGNIYAKRAPSHEKVLGLDCDLIEVFGERVLIWPGANIPLKRNRKSEYGNKSVATAVKIEENVPIPPDKFEVPEGILISLNKIESEILENKIMTQFHSMRAYNAVKTAKEEIARVVLKHRIDLRDVGVKIPEDQDDSIFADQDTLNSSYEIFIIRNEDELQEGEESTYEVD